MLKSTRRVFWVLGVLVALAVIFLPGYTKLQELRDRNRSLINRIKELSVQNTLLEEELKRIKTDSVYREKIVREKMGVVRKGEIPIKVVPGKKD